MSDEVSTGEIASETTTVARWKRLAIALCALGATSLVVFWCAVWAAMDPNLNTAYAPEFTEVGFQAIIPGTTLHELTSRLGDPLSTRARRKLTWNQYRDFPGRLLVGSGIIWAVSGRASEWPWRPVLGRTHIGSSVETDVLGPLLRSEDAKDTEFWHYSARRRGGGNYVQRYVAVDTATRKVLARISDTYYD